MRLIIDESFHPDDQAVSILESLDPSTKTKRYYIEGRMASTEKNRNGRIYTETVLRSAINKYINEHVDQKRAIGELNHPANPVPSAERASHIIEKLFWKDNHVNGRARILEAEYFPMAKIATGLIREGVKFGVSTRGLGSLTESNGVKYVGSDYFITAIDLVHEPSGIDCWVNGLHENADWIYEASSNSWILAESIKSNYSKISRKQINESAAKDFEKFLNSL